MSASKLALVLLLLGSPALADGDVTITNTFPPVPVIETVDIRGTQPVAEAPAAKPVLTEKEQKRAVMHNLDLKLDTEYKALQQKPNLFWHPIKRIDVWIDYHPNKYRKFRTRVIPISEFIIQVGAPFIAKVL